MEGSATAPGVSNVLNRLSVNSLVLQCVEKRQKYCVSIHLDAEKNSQFETLCLTEQFINKS